LPPPQRLRSPESPLAAALGNGVGYVRSRGLPAEASRDLELSVEDVRQKLGGNLQGLVLDLRGNHGGLLEQAVRVANLFVEEGVILRTVSLGGRAVEDKRASRSTLGIRAPLVVLVDEQTAAGAEVVAGALKDLGRALLIGQRTAGAGTVQVIYEFGDTDGFGKTYLRLTIAEMLRSSGLRIDGFGITPDLVVRRPPGDDAARNAWPSPLNPMVVLDTQRVETSERPLLEISPLGQEPSSANTVEGQLLDDQEVRLARDLLLGARSGGRNELLAGARALPH
jgi:carboxyl-terminal processing protease